jgi:UDP-N-acetyl-2-amino-2-deoxyglucuronate dehydrogenase
MIVLQLNMSNSTPHKRYKFAIIGCGRIAARHASIMEGLGDIIAVCDINLQQAEQLGNRYGARVYTAVSSMFEAEKSIELVAVCSPNGLHAQHSIHAMENGCDVICEKPMAIHTSDARLMRECAIRTNKNLFVVKQNRFNPPIIQLKHWMTEQKLGKILSVHVNCFWNRDENYYANSWKGSLQLDGGILYTQFSHFVDILHWLFGDADVVAATFKNLNHQGIIEFEDTGLVNVNFKSGAIGNIQYSVNAYGKNMEGSITVFGEKGTIKIGGQYLNELEYYCIQDVENVSLPIGNSANHYGHYTGTMSNHDLVYKNILEVLAGREEMATSVDDAVKTVEMIENIYAFRNILA